MKSEIQRTLRAGFKTRFRSEKAEGRGQAEAERRRRIQEGDTSRSDNEGMARPSGFAAETRVLKPALIATGGLTALATLGVFLFGAAWGVGLWVGALWGLANAVCLMQLIRSFVEKRKKLSITFWVVAKFVGLYGLLFYLLVGLRLPAGGWLAGFTLSIVGLAIGIRKVALLGSPS